MSEEDDILGLDAPPPIVASNQGTSRVRVPQRVYDPRIAAANPGYMAPGTVVGAPMPQDAKHFNPVPVGSRDLPHGPGQMRTGAEPTTVAAHEFTAGSRGGCAPVPIGYKGADPRNTGAVEGREPLPNYVMAANVAQNRNQLPPGIGEWLRYLSQQGRRPPMGVLRALSYHPHGTQVIAYAAQLNQYLDAVARAGGRVVQED